MRSADIHDQHFHEHHAKRQDVEKAIRTNTGALQNSRAQGLLPNVAVRGNSPPREEGWTRPQSKCREATLLGADGVVEHTTCTGLENHHPVCAALVASQHFLVGAATPPHEEGNMHLKHCSHVEQQPLLRRGSFPALQRSATPPDARGFCITPYKLSPWPSAMAMFLRVLSLTASRLF